MKKICKIFLLFLFISMSVFAEETTITIERLSESFDINLELQNGQGNDLILVEQDDKNFKISDNGQKITIKFTGNNGGSIAIEENGTVKTTLIDKVGDTFNYGTTEGDLKLLRFAIKNGGGSPSFENGDGATDILSLYFPENIELKTYEEYKNAGAIDDLTDDEGKTYKFTKGGAGSYIEDPIIYVIVPEIGLDGKKIKELKIEKLDENEGVIGTKTMNLLVGTDYTTGDVEINYGFTEGVNRVKVTPINEDDEVENSNSEELNFVVDTQVNDTYLEGGIIGELNDEEKIKIDLSSLEELSGVSKYSYKFDVGDEEKEGYKDDINISSSITLTTGSTNEVVEIDPSGLIAGSKGKLLFTVYDKLGHEKTFEKTYFIPEEVEGITSKIKDEVKYRNSKIKIVTEGNQDRFGIESSIAGSLE